MHIYLHAETLALKRGIARIGEESLADASLFVCRLRQIVDQKTNTRTFQWGLAKPCAGCQRAINTFNIRRVYYTLGHNTYATWDRNASLTLGYDLNNSDAHIFGISDFGTV